MSEEQTTLDIPKTLSEVIKDAGNQAARMARAAEGIRTMIPEVVKPEKGHLYTLKLPRQVIALGLTKEAADTAAKAMEVALESCAKSIESTSKGLLTRASSIFEEQVS